MRKNKVLAKFYARNGYSQKAIDYSELQLKILRQINDQKGQAYVLPLLGALYNEIGNKRSAIDYFEQSIVKMREIRNHAALIYLAQGLSDLYINLDEYDSAVRVLDQALKTARFTADEESELVVLKCLGNTYASKGGKTSQLGSLHKSIKYFETGHTLASKLGRQIEQDEFLGLLNKAKEYLALLYLMTQENKRKRNEK